jgi:hypothetical protein
MTPPTVAAFRLTPEGYEDIGLDHWLLSESGGYDRIGRRLADEHYPRRQSSKGKAQFLGPGVGRIALISRRMLSVFGWVRPLHVKDGIHAWRCTIFRRPENSGEPRASDMILDAERALLALGMEPAPDGLLTYVDPSKVRHKRDPGRCFRRAGWRDDGITYPERPDRQKVRLVKDWERAGVAPEAT